MKITVTGVDRAVGRCVADRLVFMGHDVVGVAHRRPVGWSGAVGFLDGDDRGGFASAVDDADAVVVACSVADWQVETLRQTNTTRVVAVSPSARPSTLDGIDCVDLRCGLVLGREVDDDVLAAFTSPVVFSRAAHRALFVVHPHDVAAHVVRCIVDPSNAGAGALVAHGQTSIGEIAAAVGRHVIPAPRALVPRELPATAAATGFRPVWTASECVADFALTARGRLGIGGRAYSLPWRLARVRDVPAVDVAAADGVEPVNAGIAPASGEFDTPIDPRFPAFVATNLSEALPGPFTPSSASVTVRSARAAGMVIAEHLRPGGLVQSEMAARTTGVFAHRLFAGMTSASYMALTVPFVPPEIVTTAFFGQIAERVELFGDEHPGEPRRGFRGQMRSLTTFGLNLVGLSLFSRCETQGYARAVERLEERASSPADIGEDTLHALLLSARDDVVHGWVVSSASMLVCTAYGVILRLLCGRDTATTVGRDVVSAQSLITVHRLVEAAHKDPAVMRVLDLPHCGIDDLAATAPEFHRQLMTELDVIGHRGPAELEMESRTYADDPEMLIRVIAKAVRHDHPETSPVHARVACWARPIARAATTHLRDREVRRDRMVRAIWVLRRLLRECGRRLAEEGRLDEVDDVFYLQVDEIGAPPHDLMALVRGRQAERQRLSFLTPPLAFSGHWEPVPAQTTVLRPGERLHGLGVCGGRVRGRVRVVAAETLDQLLPGEVLVAKVTDIGYTPVFAYAAAVLTELGGPISHTAIVAREYGVTCVVNADDATTRLADGAMVEIDGESGEVRVLDH